MFAGLRKMSTFATANAEIAQLVEHNLAKVRVASSSLVFRSFSYFLFEAKSPAGESPAGLFVFRRLLFP